jgi:multidrug transporter EmrE-like cation transporter
LIKRWIITHETYLFLISLIFYLASSLTWIWALKSERLVIVEALWGTLVLILTIALGLIFFQEKINWQEGIGVALAIIATILLTVKI